MNKASKKTMLIGIVLVIVLALSASVAFAATGSYSGYTYKFKDLYSTKSLTKTGTGHGCFNVTKYGDGEDSDTAMGYCDFWLEFENGARITDKAQAGKKVGKTTLRYDGTPSYYKGTSMFLCISTSLSTLNRQYAAGKWSPDNVTP